MAARRRADAAALERVRDLHVRGVELSVFGKPAAARAVLNRALRIVLGLEAAREAVTLRTQILITLAKVDSELDGIARGMGRLDEAERLLAERPHPTVLTAFHNQRGVLLMRSGRFDEAIEHFDRAERFFRTATPRDRAYTLLNRATARMLTADLRKAAGDMERGIEFAARAEMPQASEMAMHNLGYLLFLLGDLPRAIATMDAADQRENRGVVLLDRARVLVEAGLTREADAALAEAAEIVRADRLSQDLGEVELERARCALLAGDIAVARRLAAAARDRFRRRGSDSWRRSAELVLLQGDLAAGRPGGRLLDPALRLRAEFEALGLRHAARRAAWIAAEAAMSAGDLHEATAVVAASGAPRAGDPITDRLHARTVRARLHLASDAPAAASREARRGLGELAAYQSTFGSIDLQTAAAVHGRRLAELDVAVALASGRPERVLAAAEVARAASNRLPVVRPPADRVAADMLAELRQVSETLRAPHDRLETSALQRRRRELEARIAARGWTLSGSGEPRDAAPLEDISSVARAADSEVVTYVQCEGALHAVVLGSTMRLYALGAAAPIVEQVRRARADLDVLAQPHLPAAMRTAVRASFDRSMQTLGEALTAPLGLATKRVVVVSTGVLGQLPWGGLPDLAGRPVVVAPSATAWVRAVRTPRGRGTDVVALAGPGVPFAGREVAAVRRAWRTARVRNGTAATGRALVDALGTARVVHVAAHGTHNTENAMFSSLRMADGLVFAHELDRTRRVAEHVVLSSCELGLATVRPGDEALGLTSVLLRLGARSVVGGVARVNDETAATVMTSYHRELARGSDSATALAAAIAVADGVAPFVCFGSAWTPPAGSTAPRR